MSRILNVAALQMSSAPDAQANLAQIHQQMASLAGREIDLLLLPENALFMGRHEQDKLALAETYSDGPLQQALGELARQYQLHLVCGSFGLKLADQANKITTSTLVFAPSGQIVARYDKRHLFDVELASGKLYQESKYFQAGSNPPQVFDCAGVKVGLSICYDLRFPEHFRQLAEAQAEVLLVPAAFTYATGEAHWEVLLRARAIENLAAVIAANQCGQHANGTASWGHSMIIDHWGHILAQAQDTPGLIEAQIDLQEQAQRRREFPVLQHRR